jgi:fido (protein-threonine AMPylation protein)
MTQCNRPWYDSYSRLREQVAYEKSRFEGLCASLGVHVSDGLSRAWREVIAIAVRESNWQERIYLDEDVTRQLEEDAYAKLEQDLSRINGPHLDLQNIINSHRHTVDELVHKERASREEVAAFNLSTAYHFLDSLWFELIIREISGRVKQLNEFLSCKPQLTMLADEQSERAEQLSEILQLAEHVVKRWTSATIPPYGLLYPKLKPTDDLNQLLMLVDTDDLRYPMKQKYIHTLHELTMAGIAEKDSAGHYRKTPVSIGGFKPAPTPQSIPNSMQRYCRSFPSIRRQLIAEKARIDPLYVAAKFSYLFVAIHPYANGNGRLSRLIMNLLLLPAGYPPVYLKADRKGRKRYSEALKRAERGNFEPLAALIALSLLEIYSRLNESL